MGKLDNRMRYIRQASWLGFAFAILLLSAPGRTIPRAASQIKPPSQSSGWTEVERLISEQKMQEALTLTENLRAAAQKTGDRDEWARALIKEVQLRTSLSGYETAVRFLREQPWPEGLLPRAALNLFFAQSLVNYYNGYSWEINRREKVASTDVVDLKAWSKDQIYEAAQKAYQEVWQQRTTLGKEPIERLAEYLTRNNYPKGIRDTLRDAVTYLYVELLGNTALWSPLESNEIYLLNLSALLQLEQNAAGEASLLDPQVHPLRKISHLLGDLEGWHAQNGRREAALEARLTRLRVLHTSFHDSSDRSRILANLIETLGIFRDVPWWSSGKETQAELLRAGAEPGKLVRARAAADEGRRAYPESTGGLACREIVRSIDAPDFQVASMSVDGIQKRSIEVTHKNLAALHFRAYPIDLENRIKTTRNYNLLPNPEEIRTLLNGQKPAAAWSMALPATTDFEMHRTFVPPPITNPGAYVIVASVGSDFATRANRMTAFTMALSDLVLASFRETQAEFEVRTMSGETGRPIAGTNVRMYRADWRSGHQQVEERLSNADGFVRFSRPAGIDNPSFFIFAQKGADLAFDPRYFSFNRENAGPSATTASLLYTDRGIYRPLQKILWKVLIYRGIREKGEYKVLPGTPVTVTLHDANGQKVEERTATSNGFGSAASEFTIPAGRMLGRWQLRCTVQGGSTADSTSVQVEEYKRPTFEVTIPDAKSALRLNQAAVLRGEAKYYFGLPVASGLAKWRVTREPVYPMLWARNGGGATGSPQTIANGAAPLDPEGKFELSFTPQANARLAEQSKDITYRYRLTADVTDEGGETRSASKTFRLGFVSIQADFHIQRGFFPEGVPDTIEIGRTDLNETPRAGRGSWRLVALRPPGTVSMPADLPFESPPTTSQTEAEYRTPGDMQRPRWHPQYQHQIVMHGWPDGPESGRGELSHDIQGMATVNLPGLRAGAYRLYYETVDDFGSRFQTSSEFIVAGPKTSLPLPAVLLSENNTQPVGSSARFLAFSGIPDQLCYFDLYRSGRLVQRRELRTGQDPSFLEIPIREEDRGGITAKLSLLRDYQWISLESSVLVPWDNKKLEVKFSTFRDQLQPGGKETWQVNVKGPAGTNVEAGAAELLAYMYDRSLDAFAAHRPPELQLLYERGFWSGTVQTNLGQTWAQPLVDEPSRQAQTTPMHGDQLKFYGNYGVGGIGRGGGGISGTVIGGTVPLPMMARAAVPIPESAAEIVTVDAISAAPPPAPAPVEAPTPLRSEFAETAFWRPQLLTGPDGSVTIEFTVPDSVTSWNVWVHAVTRDLMGGTLRKETRSTKELMVRPYVPRFLREGDKAELKVVVNNSSARELSGKVGLDILDPESQESLLKSFGLQAGANSLPFTVKAGGGANVMFPITVPAKVGQVAFRVTAVSDDMSDGELRPLPILPGRMHLTQSRFVTLKNRDRREMTFNDLKQANDPTRVNEQMVVTVDAQLFYSVLSSLPYLVNYPYECTEQTLNRFVSTGILAGLYKNYPSVASMAAEFAKRSVPLETWDAADPNRKMVLEETPWLAESQGGKSAGLDLVNVLDPRNAKAEQESALTKLRKSQTANGAFPWWPGGPPSPYMTLYIMYGFAKAAEFGVDVPKEVVQRGWGYLAQHYRDEYVGRLISRNCCWEFLTFLNYVASCYPDATWTGNALTAQQRREILDFSFKHWKEHSPYLKCQLALTLRRAGRAQDASLVFSSVMDSAKSTAEEGIFWAPEDRSWLWYNDTIESHAFALRTLMELTPDDAKKDGLVQWIFLNKKLNHWKSTRATAEVIYSLVHYLKKEGSLGTREDATVRLGGQTVQYVFEPDRYTGKKNQTVVAGEKIDGNYATITVEKESPGFVFASATWQFSTEQLPAQGSGDFLSVSRTYFKRENTGREFVLKPIADGTALQPGDEVEVQLSIRAKHPSEYVHLRDPRAAGFEPVSVTSRYRHDLGIGWYEEVRDSGTNFFFEQLPQGEYTFKYRLRANMAGTFKVSPATLQSMYAPEFAAYSAGAVLIIR